MDYNLSLIASRDTVCTHLVDILYLFLTFLALNFFMAFESTRIFNFAVAASGIAIQADSLCEKKKENLL